MFLRASAIVDGELPSHATYSGAPSAVNIEEIRKTVEATIHTAQADQEEREVHSAFSSDLMSDVLTLLTDDLLLITGLNNVQTIRTAEMADIGVVLLVRGKEPSSKMIELAEENGIVLLSTGFSMFKSSGLLYGAGLAPVF
jgi:predicted transcriptional regulator